MTLVMIGLVLLTDLKENRLNNVLLIFFVFFGILLTLISKNSSFAKIGEIKFIIKYLVLFPSIFYIAYWVIQNYKVDKFIEMIEKVLVAYLMMAFFLAIYPVSFLYNDRGELSGFQGTFLETGWFALVVGSFLLTSVLLRLDFKLKFSKWQYILYFISTISIVLSKNKTVWVSLLLILLFLIIIKSFISNRDIIKTSVIKLINFNSFNLVFLILVLVLVFFGVNSILEDPIVSIAMLEEKIQDERGKAFLVAINLLQNSNWIGGYGFGFIEQYFEVYTDEIIGLGGGSGMIFNSYLDIWISVSLIGLFFHILLLRISFSTSHLFTMIIPFYWFIAANTNPAIGSDYYYLFLGLSYGFIIKYKKELSI
ncbi:MAG: hypothetical protein C0625_05560 [Arcobacter sp.]|nr:MAG: hypothetical protein C0625_05560 [Arcobacter sp.]